MQEYYDTTDDMIGSSKELTKEDIDGLHANLSAVYQCSQDDIIYDFHKITDEFDDDRDDHIWLIYRYQNREIFSFKMLIPEEIKQMLKYIIK